MTNDVKRILLIAAKIVLAAALIIWLLRSGKLDFTELSGISKSWPWLVLAFALFGCVLLMASLRWRLLLRAQGIHYALHDAFALTLIGLFFSQVMIGTTGGDMVKAYVVAREQRQRRSAAVISVLFDRALGLFVLLLIALVAILVNIETVLADGELATFALVVVISFVCVVLGTWAFYSDRLRSVSWLQRLSARLPFTRALSAIERSLYAYKSHPRAIRTCFAMSVLLQVCVVLTTVCLGIALLGHSFSISSFFFLIPVAHMAMALPINPPGALGTGEAIYAYVFDRVGIAQGGLLSLLMRCVNLAWAALGCVYYLQRKTRVNEAVEEARQVEEAGMRRTGPASREVSDQLSAISSGPELRAMRRRRRVLSARPRTTE
jgi:uncharacterized protein (TIRG00374 family)